MTATVVRLPDAVTHRACPKCGYLLTQSCVEAARLNFKCQKCGETRLSDFKPINIRQPRRRR